MDQGRIRKELPMYVLILTEAVTPIGSGSGFMNLHSEESQGLSVSVQVDD